MGAISKADVHLIVAIFLGAIIAVHAWDVSVDGAYESTWGQAPAGSEDLSVLAVDLFDAWAVPFEVLSVVLLVALVGALAIAIKERVQTGPGGGD